MRGRDVGKWFVYMVNNGNGEWQAATRSGALLVCGEHDLPDNAPRVLWHERSTVFAVALMSGVTITPSPDALRG
jgi:hypothetical protein